MPRMSSLEFGAKIGTGEVKSKQLSSIGIELKEIHYDFSMRRLHIETLVKMVAGIKAVYAKPLTNALELNKVIFAPLKEQGVELLKYDPEFSIDRIGIVTPEGDGYLKGVITLKGATAEDFAGGSMALIGKVHADLTIDVSEKMVQKFPNGSTAAGAAVDSGYVQAQGRPADLQDRLRQRRAHGQRETPGNSGTWRPARCRAREKEFRAAGVESGASNGITQGHIRRRRGRRHRIARDSQWREVRDTAGLHRHQGRSEAACGDSPAPATGRKPAWIRAQLPVGAGFGAVKGIVHEHRLATVCEEAKCPNIGECWNAGTATIMLMGAVCTRACRFCSVDTGNPRGWLDAEEPENTARSVELMKLKYIVLTSVNRDDLPDGGAGHYAGAIRAIKRRTPHVAVEALTPDFQGVLRDVETVVDSGLEVFAQNVETVKRLTHPVRDARASYEQTLAVLEHAKKYKPEVLTKTSLMLGLGETDEEIAQTMDDLRAVNVDLLTLGQYLRPTVHHLEVQRFVTPAEFDQYREWALAKGFRECVAGPLVRSSYRAEQALAGNNAGLKNGCRDGSEPAFATQKRAGL